ncbi:hypothetical protein JRO89_XSUnG0023800 [Xanthoceras sorbifolium]|uniref:Cupin type-1 domain-containing protein n=1 Tax=Xanthoceras sorbifolium TaxID=99658 RepID=A0ABQ8H089_9ROSI|nr:hypothetical protein JRO89_XSUnG0023800 [Xanthoceras sorbifolium]
MATYSSLLSFSLCLLILFHSCSAQISQVTSRSRQQQQRYQTQCNIQNLNALEPQQRVESEAGYTEFWDQYDEQLQCANVAVIRHTIQQKGLLVPSYTNSPQLIYVMDFKELHSRVVPIHTNIQKNNHRDSPQVRGGVAHWIYNRGQSNLVLVSLYDVGNAANQLDQLFRKFFLAGSPPQEFQGGSQSQSQRGRSQGPHQEQGRQQEQRRHRGQGQEQSGGNIFSGFNQELLAEALNIDTELVNRLQRNDPQRGIIVRVEKEFHVITPQRHEQEGREEEEEEREQQRGRYNGLEDTFCSMKLRHNINKPSLADSYNPRAGRATSINAYVLPILNNLQLSIDKVSLYKNAIYAPHWNINAHSIVYITRGGGQIQIVSESGEAVLDEQVQEGQLFVVPQGFAVVKRAGDRGLEWIAFKTNEMAMTSQLAGRDSALTSMPVSVLENAFGISREEGSRLKNRRWEMTLFTPSQSSRGGRY